jgi:hypothetical protein
VVLTTSQATLLETFNKAEVDYEQTLAPSDIVDTETRSQGIRMRTRGSPLTREQPLGFDFGIDFDQVLVDADGDRSTTNDQLVVDGSLNFNASASADIDIGWLAELDNFEFRVDLEESASVEVRGNASVGFERRITVATYSFGAFTVPVGPVPVVFHVTMGIDIGADGQFQANLRAKAVQDASVTVGAAYSEDDGWRNLNDVDSSFNFTPPEFTAAGAARAFVEPRLAVKIYGLAGPFVTAQAYLAGDADLHRLPFWRLRAGLDFGIGFDIELPVVGRVARFQRNIAGLEKELGVAPNAAPTLTVVSPEDGARGTDGDRIGFELEVRDREQEFVDVRIEEDGKTVDEERVAGTATLMSGATCQGAHTYSITATDDQGESVSETVSVVVENRVPSVTLERGSAPDPYPGGYLVAFGGASDRTCDSNNAAQPALIGWYVDGQRVGSSEELLYRVPPSKYAAGDTLSVEARYDDGQAVGRSEPIEVTVAQKPAGADLEPTPIIRTPVQGEYYKTTGSPLPFEGLGIDTEDGELPDNSLVWEIQKDGGWVEVGRGKTGSVDYYNFFEPTETFGSHRLRLTVTDSAGQSVTETVRYQVTPEG